MIFEVQPMLDQERHPEYSLLGETNYFNYGTTQHKSAETIDDRWRMKITEWAFEVVDYFSYDRDIVAMSLNYIDRFMVFNAEEGKAPFKCGRTFQLLTLTALYIAMKLHGDSSDPARAGRKPSVRLFVSLSNNRFTSNEIERMELTILTSLRWRVNPPMPATFVKYFINIFPDWYTGHPRLCQQVKSSLHDLARYLTEISCCVSEFSFAFKPSVIAYAAVLASIDVFERDPALEPNFPSYQIILQFLHKVYSETRLEPRSKDVENAICMLRDICPNIFPPNDGFLDEACKSHGRLKLVREQWMVTNATGQEEARASPTEILAFEVAEITSPPEKFVFENQ